MQQKTIRAVDIGGNGVRRANVCGKEISDYTATKLGEIVTPAQLIAFATADLPTNNDGVAFAVAGDIQHGKVIKSPNMPWLDGLDLVGRIRALNMEKVVAVNDVDGAGASMAMFPPLRKLLRFMTWSTGIGDRLAVDGRILTKSEVGHVTVDYSKNAPTCGCGKRGCLEAVIGGKAVEKRIFEYVKFAGIHIPIDEATNNPMHPCKFLDLQYKAGITGAVEIYCEIAKVMGRHLAYLQNAVFVPLIVWKGTFAINALPLIEDNIRHYMRIDLMNPDWEKETEFMISPDPQNDSLIGAAAILLDTFK